MTFTFPVSNHLLWREINIIFCDLAVTTKLVRAPAGTRLFLECNCYTAARWTFNNTNTLPDNVFFDVAAQGVLHYNTLLIMNTELLFNEGYYTCYCSQNGHLKVGKRSRIILKPFRHTVAV